MNINNYIFQFKEIIIYSSILIFGVFISSCNSINNINSINSKEEIIAYQKAAKYSRAHRGLSLVVMRDGKIIFEDYPGVNSANDVHNIYSGTKSFCGVIAVAAIMDSLITNFDELVSVTITEWKTDPRKSKITIRQLLKLVSGIDASESGNIPNYSEAIQSPALYDTGKVFQYGPAPFQVFGELMLRKLKPMGEDLQDYFKRRVLLPIGVNIAKWRTTDDGNLKMSAGAFLTARDWAKFGQLILNHGRWQGKVILDEVLLNECSLGSTTNPSYGISFWLPMNEGVNDKGEKNEKLIKELKEISAPEFIIKAAGVGGQKLYIFPSENMVIVRQASRLPFWGRGFNDADFLAPIFKKSM